MSETEPVKADDVVAEGDRPAQKPGSGWSERIVVILIAAVLGGVAGFGASALHPGAKGLQGKTGKTGLVGATGLAGAAGAAGNAAQVSNLGVCVNVTYASSSVSYVQGVSIQSPSQRSDGTTYCPVGNYVPVVPQSQTP